MKTFYQFINESLKPFGSKDASSSEVFSNSRHAVLKKSKNRLYHDLEFEVHEMMKKRPDLFCKILKNSKEHVVMEKLDCDNFLKFYKTNLKELEGDSYHNFHDSISDEDDYRIAIKFKNSSEFKQLSKPQQDFINLKINIFSFFKKFRANNIKDFDLKVDLHENNFGFIKASQEIRCFDPIFIDLKN